MLLDVPAQGSCMKGEEGRNMTLSREVKGVFASCRRSKGRRVPWEYLIAFQCLASGAKGKCMGGERSRVTLSRTREEVIAQRNHLMSLSVFWRQQQRRIHLKEKRNSVILLRRPKESVSQALQWLKGRYVFKVVCLARYTTAAVIKGKKREEERDGLEKKKCSHNIGTWKVLARCYSDWRGDTCSSCLFSEVHKNFSITREEEKGKTC